MKTFRSSTSVNGFELTIAYTLRFFLKILIQAGLTILKILYQNPPLLAVKGLFDAFLHNSFGAEITLQLCFFDNQKIILFSALFNVAA